MTLPLAAAADGGGDAGVSRRVPEQR